MEYIRPKAGDIYLSDVSIENIFINEYMPDADGDHVKVYLLGRLYAEIGRPLTEADMARELGISEKVVSEAWNYWESLGAIRKIYPVEEGRTDFAVEFVDLKSLVYGRGGSSAQPDPEEIRPTETFGNDAVKKLMETVEKELGRTLSSTEMHTIIGWVQDLGATPEVVRKAVSYCAEKGKVNFKYISKVVGEWCTRGFRTAAAVDEYLEEIDQRHFRQRRILKALGLSRNPTEAESAMMDQWFDELGFTMDRVLQACARTTGISNPNIKYVDSTLRNWKQEEAAGPQADGGNRQSAVTAAVLKDYYEFLRNRAEREAAQRRSKIYRELPKIEEIDNRINDLGIKLTRAVLRGNGAEESDYNEQIERLYEDRAILLTENDYDMNYTDVQYLCDRCNDTGVGEMGEPCTFCMSQRIAEAEEWQKQRKKDAKE